MEHGATAGRLGVHVYLRRADGQLTAEFEPCTTGLLHAVYPE
jgi:hypothetical protein